MLAATSWSRTTSPVSTRPDMRPSRGMGAVAQTKMPKRKKLTRKDDPNSVDVYAKGGAVKEKKPK